MSLYLDSSALLSVLLDERKAPLVRVSLATDEDWVTARHTYVEVRRNLARGTLEENRASALEAFLQYWARLRVVELDIDTCMSAADLAVRTGVRTLDALHLAAAQRGGGSEIVMLTLDRRLWLASRSIGMAATDVAGFEAEAAASP